MPTDRVRFRLFRHNPRAGRVASTSSGRSGGPTVARVTDADVMGGVVGALTLADTSLCALLADVREAVTEYGPVEEPPSKITTGQLADDLLGLGKRHPILISDDMRQWLLRVKRGAKQRNEVVHAIGRDRCVGCGRSSRFEHKGKSIDPSEERVRKLINDVDVLLAEGVELARALAKTLNERLVAAAKKRAAETGEPQTPPQIMIGGNWHQCADCSGSGQAKTVVSLGTAVAVFPPGTDLRGLFQQQE
jgi:hypothetical protein